MDTEILVESYNVYCSRMSGKAMEMKGEERRYKSIKSAHRQPEGIVRIGFQTPQRTKTGI